MAKKATQIVMDVFNEKRDLIIGLKAEQRNAMMKLKEAIHRSAAMLDRQETPTGEQKLIYVCGDYRVALKTKEEIAVKIAEESKEGATAPPADDDQHFEPSDADVADPNLEVEVKK